MVPRIVVGVCPPAAMQARPQLFAVLEQVFPVHFDTRQPGELRGLDALISFSGEAQPEEFPGPSLAIAGADRECQSPTAVRFRDTQAVDRRLRGQTLDESHACIAAVLQPAAGDAILAECTQGPLWLRRGRCTFAATAPAELEATQTLRDHLMAGRFLGLLPLVQFLRDLQPADAWQVPPLRAAFIFDDPNLRTSSYGFLHYPRLAEHAVRHGYHVVLASIPLDYRFASQQTTRLFREQARHLSLTIHGNNHERLELLKADSSRAAVATAAQALRRAAAFERSSGLRVSRVMCPPHEVCSDAMRSALFALGYEAICTAHALRPGSTELAVARRLAEWQPAQLVAGGLPALSRHSLARSLDDIVLRAYLDQPLLLFGHHQDVANGLDSLEKAAARINSLGAVQWGSLTEICQSNFFVRREGCAMRVQLFTRRARLVVPEGVDALILEVPPVASAEGAMRVACADAQTPACPDLTGSMSLAFVGPFPAEVVIELKPARPINPAQVPAESVRWWPIVRRGLTEGRDRIAPLRGGRFADRQMVRRILRTARRASRQLTRTSPRAGFGA